MKNLSLTQKALMAVIIILLPVVFTFLSGYEKNKEAIVKHSLHDLEAVADAYEGQVFLFLEMSKRRLEDFSTDGYLREELKRIIAGDINPARLNEYLQAQKLPVVKLVNAIHVISLDGMVIASTDKGYIGSDVSMKRFFTKGVTGPNITEITGENNEPEIAISSPIIDRATGERLGVLTNFMYLSELSDVLSGEMVRELGAISTKKGRHGSMEAYLVNDSRLMITRSKFTENEVPNQVVDTMAVSACLERGEELTGFYKNYRGTTVAGTSMCLPHFNWVLLVEVEEVEILAPLKDMRRDALIAAFIVGTLIVILLLLFIKTIVRPIRKIARASESFGEGNYDISIPVMSADEVGTLSTAFNSMASELKTRTKVLEKNEEKYRLLISNMPGVAWTSDKDGRTVFISSNAKDLCGYAPEDICLKPYISRFDNIHPDDAHRIRKAFTGLFAEGKKFDVEYRFKRKDGEFIWVHDMATTTYEKDGLKYADGVFFDITSRKRMEQALSESEALLKEAERIGHMGSWDWDIINNDLSWSDEIYRIFGLKPQEFGATYEAFLNSVHPDDREFVKESVHKALYYKEDYSIDHRIVLPSGEVRTVHERARVFLGPTGIPARMVGTVQDITEQKRAEFELKKLSTAIEQSVNLVFITDINGVIEYVNPTFVKVTGYTKDEVIGQTPRILSSGETSQGIYKDLWTNILAGRTWRGSLKNRTKTGGFYWCNTVISPIQDDTGSINHFLTVQENTTERMKSEERLKYLAHFDPLTGLVNRSRFMELLDDWILKAAQLRLSGSLLLIDIDQFKFLNDTYGHGAGDEILRRLTEVLKNSVEKLYQDYAHKGDDEPILGRLSGDEFAVFLPAFVKNDALYASECLRKAVEGTRFSDDIGPTSISIGIADYPEHGTGTRELFTKADAAMFRAKDLGRNRSHVYRNEDQELEKMHSRLSWKGKVLKALQEDRIVPWFQPILDLSVGRVHHYEVLARMEDEDGKILLPGAFIEVAERFGLVGAIDRIIIEKALRLQSDFDGQGKPVSFAINLSGNDIGDEDLLSFIKDKLAEHGTIEGSITFEITETSAIGDLESADKFIKALRDLGCQFSIDDFGVGYTSFAYLKGMEVDYIKIDGSFIRSLHENPKDQALVKAMVELARGLKIKTIAEFVEDEKTLELLRTFGVDFAQGYLIGKPCPGFGESTKDVARFGT